MLARALIIFVAMVATHSLAVSASPADVPLNIALAMGASLPIAASTALIWALVSPVLRRLAYWQAAFAIGAAMVLITILSARWFDAAVWRAVPLALSALAAMLVYFHTLGRALSPAVTEARLAATSGEGAASVSSSRSADSARPPPAASAGSSASP